MSKFKVISKEMLEKIVKPTLNVVMVLIALRFIYTTTFNLTPWEKAVNKYVILSNKQKEFDFLLNANNHTDPNCKISTITNLNEKLVNRLDDLRVINFHKCL